MYAVIMGCGRVGRALAQKMVDLGNEVSVIDHSEVALAKLGKDFPGKMTHGSGFDKQVLLDAGIEQADCFAAVSSGDNTNIIAARIAREEFDVPRVIARIYDGRRAEIYERLGIPTVATVPWAAERLLHVLTNDLSNNSLRDPSGQITLIEVDVNSEWFGKPLLDLEKATAGRCAFITRNGKAAIPTMRTHIQDDDHIWLSVPTSRVDEVLEIAAEAPTEEK